VVRWADFRGCDRRLADVQMAEIGLAAAEIRPVRYDYPDDLSLRAVRPRLNHAGNWDARDAGRLCEARDLVCPQPNCVQKLAFRDAHHPCAGL
jgi:hypothetical protein